MQPILSREEAILSPLSNISIVDKTPTRDGTDVYVPGDASDTLRADSLGYLIAIAILLMY